MSEEENNQVKQHMWYLVMVALCATFLLGPGEVVRGDGDPPSKKDIPGKQDLFQAENLLVNGSMEDGFYWKYPNHFVANGWQRWWIHGTVLPEYDDTNKSAVRPEYDGKHAQTYFKWGNSYTAGIYQLVTGLSPCTPYQLTMWARNHSLDSALPHARIGLDPQGLLDFASGSAGKSNLPPHTVWSTEQTALFTWEQLSVQVEPVEDRLTAILYASPSRPDDGLTYYFDTFWDAGRLIHLSSPDGRLSEPDSWTPSGFIQNLSAVALLDRAIITWNTPSPASTQVWYEITSSTGVAQNPPTALATPVDLTPVTQHRVVIEGLHSGEVVSFVALSRRPVDAQCVTEVSAVQSVSALLPTDRVPPPDPWTPSSAIQNLAATPVLDNIIVTWDTPDLAATTQVWYDGTPAPTPITHTGTLSYPIQVYLPLVAASRAHDHNYEFATYLNLAPVTHHRAYIKGLQEGDTVHLVALSSYVVNDERVVTLVSDSIRVTMGDIPPITRNYLPMILRQ
jgi:hypothetical protein